MVTVDNGKCVHCGVCLELRGGYCIGEIEHKIVINGAVCNACQECIAVCPQMAFTNGGIPPVRIVGPSVVKPADLAELMRRRRSIRHFKNSPIPRAVLARVVAVASRAPTMNKSIEAVVIDDAAFLSRIDADAMRRYMKIYRLFFSKKPLLSVMRLFSDTLPVIKRKMERDLLQRKHILKDNTQALVLLIGRIRVPLTEISAQYGLANILTYAETEGLGSCLMDSLKISINRSRAVRRLLNIPRDYKILGVLALGYPEEKILNIPEGYEMKTSWNVRD